ncbi:MAG: hypothetical protein RR863_00245 [Erysipelotrichaceae bacterium]
MNKIILINHNQSQSSFFLALGVYNEVLPIPFLKQGNANQYNSFVMFLM